MDGLLVTWVLCVLEVLEGAVVLELVVVIVALALTMLELIVEVVYVAAVVVV